MAGEAALAGGAVALEVAGGGGSAAAPAPAAGSRRHDTFPRWFRMSMKLAVLVMLLSLPALALRDPSLNLAGNSGKYTILLMLLGTVAIPMWVPHVGTLVLMFTAIIPVAFAGIWISYGLQLAYHNVWFLQISIVVAGFLLFFGGTMAGLPSGIVGAFMALFGVCIGHYLMTPKLALMLAEVISAAIVVAAILVTVVFSIVFPEYCTDQVWLGHHEGLEHLLHMAHHIMRSKPPRFIERGLTSDARRLGSDYLDRSALRAASRGASHAAKAGVAFASLDDDGGDDVAGAGGGDVGKRGGGCCGRGGLRAGQGERVRLTPAQKAERSFHRVVTALASGAKAVAGSKAELVVGYWGNFRPVLPWFPLLPAPKCRADPADLAVLRGDVTAVALALYRLSAALTMMGVDTKPDLVEFAAANGASWDSIRASLLGALQELVDAFPQDAYPAPRPIDMSHAEALVSEACGLAEAWQRQAASGGGGSVTNPATRLHGTLMIQVLADTAKEVRRLSASAQAAMAGLERVGYGCCLGQCFAR